MKKLIVLSYTILCSVLMMLSYMNFSYDVLEKVENDKQMIVIEKTEGQTNGEFLNQIADKLQKINADIMYKYVEVDGTDLTYHYYRTRNTDTFLEEGAAKVLPNVAFYNLEKAECYDLKTGTFYVDKADSEQTINAIQKLGYKVTINSSTTISGKTSIGIFATIPIFLVIMSMVFYVLSIGKKTMLRKMEGYTTLDVLKEEFVKQLPFLISISLVLEAIVLGMVAYSYNHAWKAFLMYEASYMLLLLSVIFVGLVLSLVAVYSQKQIAYMKGKVPKKGMYVISMCATGLFMVFIVFFMTIGIRNVKVAYDTYKTAHFMADKVEGYVTVPIYENSASSEGLENNYMEFYRKTVNEFQGVLVDAGNYKYDLVSGTTMCEDYDQDWITVNENYLKINPIYDSEENEIKLSDDAGKKLIDVIIPTTKKDEKDKFKTYLSNAYSADANFIEYDEEKTKIFSYNAAVGNGTYGEIDAPVIIVLKEENLDGQFVLSYCSTDSYFLKVSTEKPYEELKPTLTETGIITVTPDTPYVASNYTAELAQQVEMLKIYASQSMFLSVGIGFLVIFSAMLFCENYRRKIVSKLIEGYSMLECIKNHLILKVFIYIISALVTNVVGNIMQVAMNDYIIVGAFVIDVIITLVLCNKITKRNVYQIVKGEE